MDAAAVEDNTSTRKTAKSTSSQASRVRRAELETAIAKKQLGQERLKLQTEREQLQKQHELMYLKLALKLLEFQGEDDGISDKSSESRVESGTVNESCGPDVDKWVKVDTPWGLAHKQQDHHSVSQLNRIYGKCSEKTRLPSGIKILNSLKHCNLAANQDIFIFAKTAYCMCGNMPNMPICRNLCSYQYDYF
ncbi:hypothetical protein HHI36_020468 [Cryptolaemus montrouzieri]|uniref:Uncharacterized protein n=1 Tax=Cryptolaemus montrouzieri TaxID=559131 RepID=A0ABD2NBD9_9CUCU